jgi:hypothetical protein
MIIGLSGKIGSGKSTVSEIFQQNGYYLDSFANSVKDVSNIIFGFDRNKLDGLTKEDREWREKPDEKYSLLLEKSFSPRDSLILIGTNFGRNLIHKDVWIETVFNRYNLNQNKKLLITDVRFPNEYDSIKKRNGVIIRLERNNLNLINHESETSLDNHEFDFIIYNNGTIDELKEKIITIIKKLN